MNPEKLAVLRQWAATTTGLVGLTAEELSALILDRDHHAAEAKAFREATRAALAELTRRSGDPSHCELCRGSGMVEPWCRHCGDSTYDHDCPPAEPCGSCQGTGRIPAVVALVALLGGAS